MDIFLDTDEVIKLNQKGTNNLTIPTMNNEIDTVIKFSQQRKTQDQMDSLLNSTRCLKNNTNTPQSIKKKHKGKQHFQAHSMKPAIP
jgi:hypothetical protein